MSEFVSANILQCKVATTGYCGGDSGHGARHLFELRDMAGTDMDVSYSEKRLVISLGGDTELDTFVQALEWAASELKRMAAPSNG